MKKSAYLAVLVLFFFVLSSRAQVLFQDNFDTDTSGSWSVFQGSANNVSDYDAKFAFDYGTNKYTISYNGGVSFTTATIPPAPNSAGTTKGLRLTVNKNDNLGRSAGVSLYPTNQTFSGNYALRFDMWINYTGWGFGSGAGGTEYATFGINHAGNKVNWHSSTNSDGLWFSVDGDGDSATDYRAYVGNGATAPTQLTSAAAGFLDRDGDGVQEVDVGNVANDPFRMLFPSPPFESGGLPSKRWVQCEIRHQNNTISWLIDGYVICRSQNTTAFTNGNIMLGYMDVFTSIASPREDCFGLFDNVRVIAIGPDPVQRIEITAADDTAAEPGSDTGTFTVTRIGNTTTPLTIALRVGGSAVSGVDYAAIPTTIVFPAGQSSTNIVITPINDSIGEATETVVLSAVVTTNFDYEMQTNFSATVNILDDGDLPTVTLATKKSKAYERMRSGLFSVDLSSLNSSDTTIPLVIGGTATNGIDYITITNSVTVPAGQTNVLIDIVPINNGRIDGTRTVTITVGGGTNYALGTITNGTVTIKDDDFSPAAGVLFSDNFDTDTSANWFINPNRSDDTAEFLFDYSSMGIPPAPAGPTNTTLGVKLRANTSLGPVSGISLSPKNQTFTGDYRLRFDMWINYNGPLTHGGSGSTEFFSAGVGTSGNHANWDSGSNSVDGVWFAVDGDGGDGAGTDYRAYIGPTQLASGYIAGAQIASNPYYNEFGGDPAPLSQQASYPGFQVDTTAFGNCGFAWHDVIVSKRGNTVTWIIDSLPIATVVATNTLANNIFIGYFDGFTGVAPAADLSFGVVDNVRVELLPAAPTITNVQKSGNNVIINFTGSTSDSAANFVLEGKPAVTDAFATEVGALPAVQIAPGSFQITTPMNGTTRFYRVRR